MRLPSSTKWNKQDNNKKYIQILSFKNIYTPKCFIKKKKNYTHFALKHLFQIL